MSPITYKTVDQHLKELNKFLKELEYFAKPISSLKEYQSKKRQGERRIIERELQLTLEATLSIVRMIIGLENLEYHDEVDAMILELARFGIFPKSFAKKMEKTGGFRNVLVHGYVFIKDKEVYKNLEERDKLKQFAKYIARYLKPRLS